MAEFKHTNRVGLLTLPLSNNYGGILQMIALHEVLKQEGFEPILIDKKARFRTAREKILNFLGMLPMQNFRGARGRAINARRHRRYYESLVGKRTVPVWTTRDVEKEIERLGISSALVGSDQVWRMGYQKDADELNYFLDFGNANLTRVSYAASFGHGSWVLSDKTTEIQRCLSRFDAVSVREKSGQTICSEVFMRDDAELVLDPTLLLDSDYYLSLMLPKVRSPSVLVYVLDRQEDARRLANEIAQKKGNLPVRVLSPSAREFVSIPDWLSEFANAEFVVTDSFHGTIFSILFRKPFLTLLNSRRGLDRFTTLFETFGLSDRGLTDWQGELPDAVSLDPDFEKISGDLDRLRKHSRSFLRNALSKQSQY